MNKLKLILLSIPAFLFFGCATIDKDADAIIVQTERTLSIALSTFDMFLKFEYENRAALEQISPDIKKFADVIRKNGKNWIESANNLKIAYKHNRTEQSKVSLISAMAIVQTALAEANKYLSASQLKAD